MKLIEQTSNQLLLRDSSRGVWLLRLVCTPFLIFGIVGLFIVITEKVLPSLFIIFCLAVGILGFFLTSHQTIYLDKSQNKLTIKTKKILGTKKEEYPLDNLNVRVERTSWQVKTYSSIFRIQKEAIYIVVLEIPAYNKTIKISSNYSLLQNQAIEIANLIRTFLNIPPETFLQPQISANPQNPSGYFKLNASFWKSKVLWFVPLIIISILWHNIDWNQFSFTPKPQMYCSQDATQSPYCDFALVYTLENHPNASAITMSDDGKTLISGGQDKAIKVWDLQTGSLQKTLQSNSGEIYSVAIAPNRKIVVSGSGDRRIRIWDLTSDKPPQILGVHNLTVNRVEISADGKTVISHSDNELKAWDLATGQLKATLTLPFFRLLDINRENQTALIKLANEKLVVWNAATNQQNVLPIRPNLLRFASISLDEQTLVAIVDSSIKWGGKRRLPSLKIWDLPTAKIKAKDGTISSRILDTALTRTHLIGSTEDRIKVWNLQTAKLEATLNTPKIKNLVVSSDGKLLAGTIGDSNRQNTQILVWKRP